MARLKLEQLVWPERGTDDVVGSDETGEASLALIAELEAGRLVAVGNLDKPIATSIRHKYEALAQAFGSAQTIVAMLWQQAHSQRVVPAGFRPYIHSPDANGVFMPRS